MHFNNFDPYSYRQRREHRVFEKLLGMIPGLEERLVNGSDTEVLEVAEHVSQFIFNLVLLIITHLRGSSKRDYPLLELMTQRA